MSHPTSLDDGRRQPPPSQPVTRNARCACGSGRRAKHCCDAFAGPQEVDDPRMNRALGLQRHQRFEDARALYEAVLAERPWVADALHMLGVIHLQTGNCGAALPLLLRAAEAFEWKLPAVRHNLGLATAAVLTDDAPGALDALWAAYARHCDRPPDPATRARIGVVIPSHDHARYVVDALDSVRRQTRLPDHVVVIDDGSSDGSVARIEATLRDFPCRVTFRARDNRGAAVTINEGVALCEADFVNVLNSDDRFTPTRLAAMERQIVARGAQWGHGRICAIDPDGARVDVAGDRAAELAYLVDDVAAHDTVGLAFLAGNGAVSTGNLFFARALFDRLGGFADLRYNHDWDFCLRAVLVAEPVFVPQVSYEYRLHDANTIREAPVAALAEMQAVFARFYASAVAHGVPANPFAPVPAVWGARFFASALGAGHGAMVPPAVLRDCATRALRRVGASDA